MAKAKARNPGASPSAATWLRTFAASATDSESQSFPAKDATKDRERMAWRRSAVERAHQDESSEF